MADSDDKTLLLIKKLGGLALVVFGLLLAGIGFSSGQSLVGGIGVLLLVAGIVVLVLKVIRRNQGA